MPRAREREEIHGTTGDRGPPPTLTPPTQARPTLSSSHLLVGLGGDVPGCASFPGPPAGSPPPPPPSSHAAVGRSPSAAAQSGPLAARRIAAPPRPIQPAEDARFPPAQSAAGPAPPARGPQPTPTWDPLGFHGSPPPPHAAQPTRQARSPRSAPLRRPARSCPGSAARPARCSAHRSVHPTPRRAPGS